MKNVYKFEIAYTISTLNLPIPYLGRHYQEDQLAFMFYERFFFFMCFGFKCFTVLFKAPYLCFC